MRGKFNHRGQEGKLRARRKVQGAMDELTYFALRFPLCSLPFAVLFLCVLCGKNSLAQTQPHQPPPPEKRIQYRIDLSLDYANRKYTGSERVRWVNRGERATGTLIFHLYSNARTSGYVAPKQADEPRLEIVEVKSGDTEAPLPFTFEDDNTILRVNLRTDVQPQKSAEVLIKFRGEVPEIDPDETGLVAHAR